MKHILFVCTGNSCRSVMAEGIFRKLISDRLDDFSVVSAGTSAAEGFPATQETVNVLTEEGIDVSDHQSQRLTYEMIRTADKIYVMEKFQMDFILQMAPEAAGKVSLMTDYYPHAPQRHHSADIPDPIRMSGVFYKNVYSIIRDCVKKIVEGL